MFRYKGIPLLEDLESADVPVDLDEAFIKYMDEAKGTPGQVKFGTPTDKDIATAVAKRQYVGIYYEEKDDHNLVLKGFRLIEPICFGQGYKYRKDGVVVVNNKDKKYLRAFVIKDSSLDVDTKKQFKTRRKSVSKTQKIPYFRMFRTDRMQSWFAFPFVFSKWRTSYNPKDRNMVKIIAALDQSKFPRGQKANR
jgi:hypothetical protein